MEIFETDLLQARHKRNKFCSIVHKPTYLPPFNSHFLGEPRSAGTTSALCLHLFHNSIFKNVWHRFFIAGCPFCHPISSFIVQKERQSSLIPTSGLASSFLHPLPDSWCEGHCYLYAGFPVPVSDSQKSTRVQYGSQQHAVLTCHKWSSDGRDPAW